MKKITKTMCAAAILFAVACKKETPQPQTVIKPVLIGTVHHDTTTIIKTDTIKTVDTVQTHGMTVFYSDWFTPGHWTASPSPTTGTGLPGSGTGTNIPSNAQNQSNWFTIAAPIITRDILDRGIVLAYCRLANDNGNTRQLPATTTLNDVLNIWNYVMRVGSIQFTQFSTMPILMDPADNSNAFRYVVVPGTLQLRLRKPLNQMSYHEVCTLLNIPE